MVAMCLIISLQRIQFFFFNFVKEGDDMMADRGFTIAKIVFRVIYYELLIDKACTNICELCFQFLPEFLTFIYNCHAVNICQLDVLIRT